MRLSLLGVDAQRAVCGHGQIDLERAAYSDDARVALYAEANYRWTISRLPGARAEPFQIEQGRRTIRVTLAYDPPVRHTRATTPATQWHFA